MIRRVSLAVAGSLLVSLTLSAQRPETFRSLGSFTGQLATDPHASPDGRFVLLGTNTELRVYNVSTKKTIKLADGRAWDLAWSPKLDRIAWVRADADGKGQYVWTMPIDPRTALGTGAAQRATIGYSDYPQFSPDGKLIAFSSPDSGAVGNGAMAPHRLSVVPATGGPEHVVANFDGGFEGEFWSADGKSLFVPGTPRGSPKANIARVYLDGTAPRVIRQGHQEWVAGMTSDHTHLVAVPARNPISAADSAIVLDTDGNEVGRAALPLGTINEYDSAIDSALVWVWITNKRQFEIGSLHGATAKQIPVGESPVWSPDGKSIAFQVQENGHNVLATMRADGSGTRVFHDAGVRPDQWGARWSPDSKWIGYYYQHRFMALDVATGASRVLLEDTTRNVGLWTWRSDSKSLVAMRFSDDGLRTFDEISDGTARTLFDMSRLASRGVGLAFIDGSTAYLRSDSVAFLIPLTGGDPRRIGEVPRHLNATTVAAVSKDHRMVASLAIDKERGEANQIEIVSLESGEHRALRVPFSLVVGAQPAFIDGDKSLLAFGRQAGNDTTGVQLFAIPLNGDQPRIVATVNNPSGVSVSVAPDGQSIAYTVPSARTTSLLLVDLRSVLKRSVSSRSPRRAPEH
jgi:dipeptidyl aminopeptidase/acylaminoacyl peptidase